MCDGVYFDVIPVYEEAHFEIISVYGPYFKAIALYVEA